MTLDHSLGAQVRRIIALTREAERTEAHPGPLARRAIDASTELFTAMCDEIDRLGRLVEARS